jgi:transposase InsO family protein
MGSTSRSPLDGIDITSPILLPIAHFKKELKKFDRRYNPWRKSQALEWKTPAQIYNDNKYFRKAPETDERP